MNSMKRILALAALAAFMVLGTTETTHAVDWVVGGQDLGSTGYLGSTDDEDVYLIVDAQVAYRWLPHVTVPNIVGGESNNEVKDGAFGATICGGGYDAPSGTDYPNVVADNFGFVGGGRGNQAGTYDYSASSHPYATVCGGYSNGAWASYSFVGGGYDNIVDIENAYGTICGGSNNDVTDDAGTVCGGQYNAADNYCTVGGGYHNSASSYMDTVGGGYYNTASGYYSAVPGGYYNTASGNYSFAAGYLAEADDRGCFMWADYDSIGYDVACPGENTFNVRARGGIWFGSNSAPTIGAGRFINTSTGGYLSTGGAWTDSSSPAVKTDIEAIDPEAVLDTLRDLPVSEWSYLVDPPGVRHMGPMADDFYSLFGLGNDETGIASLDTAGVALAAIQALDRRVQELDAEVAGMRVQAAKLQGLDGELKGKLAQITELQERLARLEKERNEAPAKLAAMIDVNQVGLLVLALLLAGAIGRVSRRSRG